MIGLIDYDAGNARSLSGALEELGCQWSLVGNGATLAKLSEDPNSRIILPGVGAFGAAMDSLGRRGLADGLKEWLGANRPFLGICLGLQLLYEASQESPGVAGLGLLKGECQRFGPGLKVPCIGWNVVRPRGPSPIFPDSREAWFYFVHSYHPPLDSQDIAATTDYGIEYPCAITRGRIQATQFHPEKSSKAGLRLLKGWLDS